MQGNKRAGGTRLLAIDEEYLIALDIQNILQEYNEFDVEVETLARFEDTLSSIGKYDIVIIDPGPMCVSRCEIAAAIERSGAALVWSSTELSASDTPIEGELAPVVSKPFSSRDLLEAIERALAPSQPLKARAVAELLAGSGP